jgi:uncharacterized C2H2 Zn-finger protein
VELEVRREHGLYELGKKDAAEMNEEALRLFNRITEDLNLKCPRCKMAFHDYTGCNALTCANTACNAKFCAICLKDCGSDAHAHVRQAHGNLFDRKMFESSREKRSKDIIDASLANLESSGKSFDLRQLLRNQLERTGHLGGAECSGGADRSARFVAQATRDLERVIASDRLSILSDNQDCQFTRHGIQSTDISPRAAIPDDVRTLCCCIYTLT